MLKRLQHLRRDERGFSVVFGGLGLMAFMSATTLAIDVGMLMTARTQAQTAADAGALAGATALAFNDFNDRSASGPAVQSAINAAQANRVMATPPSVLPADVTFPNDPSGEATRITVQVFRTTDRNNAVPTLIGQVFGVPTVSIGATATAEASPANAETCVMPFTIPDKWRETTNPAWDPDDTFDLYKNNGQPLADPDVYIRPGQPGATGYSTATDTGLQLVLKTNNQNKVAPSFYNPWDLPGSAGGSDYRDNIANCNTNIVTMGDPMTAEPGNMIGPTQQGVEDLIAKDPAARWDTACTCVRDSAFPISPRIAVVPLYDPYVYETDKHNGKNASLTAVNFLGFFIEPMQGNQVVGRITPIGGLVSGNGPLATGAFPKAIRLVQ